jgi:hypothetical protein
VLMMKTVGMRRMLLMIYAMSKRILGWMELRCWMRMIVMFVGLMMMRTKID